MPPNYKRKKRNSTADGEIKKKSGGHGRIAVYLHFGASDQSESFRQINTQHKHVKNAQLLPVSYLPTYEGRGLCHASDGLVLRSDLKQPENIPHQQDAKVPVAPNMH